MVRTAMAIYQRCQPGDKVTNLKLSEPTTYRSLNKVPCTPLLDCSKPVSQPPTPTNPKFYVGEDLVDEECLPDAVWLLGRTIAAHRLVPESFAVGQYTEPAHDKEEDREKSLGSIPPWSGYNSLTSKELPVTRVRALPLLAAPAHEWQTLLTILMQAQSINAKVIAALCSKEQPDDNSC